MRMEERAGGTIMHVWPLMMRELPATAREMVDPDTVTDAVTGTSLCPPTTTNGAGAAVSGIFLTIMTNWT